VFEPDRLVNQTWVRTLYKSSRMLWLFHCDTGNLLNMTKLSSIGLNRFVSVKKQDGVLNLTIYELGLMLSV
jgi:hypothetical protein